MSKWNLFLSISSIASLLILVCLWIGFNAKQEQTTEASPPVLKPSPVPDGFHIKSFAQSPPNTIPPYAVSKTPASPRSLDASLGKSPLSLSLSTPKPKRIKSLGTFKLTYYDADECGKTKSHKAYGITKSGRPVQKDITIAVDPRVIPLGSWVEIQFDNGKRIVRRADDTGGKIKGKRIDLYVPEATLAMGVKKVNVHLVNVNHPHPPENG